MKPVTITLSYPHNSINGKNYQIEKVVNSTEHNPGDRLTKDEVNNLIGFPRYNVTIQKKK